MPAGKPTQTLPKRRVGQMLRTLRERSGITVAQIAPLLHRNKATVYRWEDGHSLCSVEALDTLLDHYGATLSDRKAVEQHWTAATQTHIPPGLPARDRNMALLMSSEADAVRITSLHQLHVPTLCQTPRYAAALLRAAQRIHPTINVEQDITTRMRRQELFNGARATRLRCYLDESAIRRQVGGPAVMAEQLSRLLIIGELNTISLRIIPLRAGEHGSSDSAITMHQFANPSEPPCIYLELEGSTVPIIDADTPAYLALFDDLDDIAQPENESAALIRAEQVKLESALLEVGPPCSTWHSS